MYASFRSVTAKNGKTLTPTRKGIFFVDLNRLGILRDVYEFAAKSVPTSHWVSRLSKNFKLKRTTSHAETETDTASKSS